LDQELISYRILQGRTVYNRSCLTPNTLGGSRPLQAVGAPYRDAKGIKGEIGRRYPSPANPGAWGAS